YVGILLLRHHRTARGERIGQFDKAKFTARPQHQLFGEAAQMHAQDGTSGEEFDEKITIRYRVEAVLTDARKAQEFGDMVSVNGQGSTSQGSCTKRQHVDALTALLQPFLVTAAHVIISEQVMGEKHGLRALEMGIPRDHNITVAFRQASKLFL